MLNSITKKGILIIIFMSLSVFCFSDFEFNVTQKFKKGEGEITVKGKSFEEVEEGVAQTLIRLKCKIVERDKEGLIVAERKGIKDVISDTGSIESTEEYVSAKWEIMIDSDDEKIVLVCAYTGTGAGFWGGKKKSFIIFCSKLESVLRR